MRTRKPSRRRRAARPKRRTKPRLIVFTKRKIGFVPPGKEVELVMRSVGEYEGGVQGDGTKQDDWDW